MKQTHNIELQIRKEAIRLCKKYVNPKNEIAFGEAMATALFWLNRGAVNGQVREEVKRTLENL